MQWRLIPLAVLAFGLGSPLLFAQDYSVDTREKLPDRDAPYANQTSLSTERANDEDAALADLIDRSAGVTLRRSGLETEPTYVAIRGANPRQLVVTWNGLPIAPPFGPGFDFGAFDPNGFDSVSVQRGGSSAGKGNGAISGSIDLARSKPNQPGARSMLFLSRSSFDSWRAKAKTTVRNDDAWGVLSASLQTTEGDFRFVDRQGVSQIRVGAQSRRLQTTGTFATQVSDRFSARTDVIVSRRDGGSAGPSEFQRQFVDASSTSDQLALSVSLDARGLSDGAADSSLQFGLVRHASLYENDSSFLGAVPFRSENEALQFTGALRERIVLGDHLLTASLFAHSEAFSQRTSESDPLDVRRTTARLQVGEEWFVSSKLVLALFAAGAVLSDRDLQWAVNGAVRYSPLRSFMWTTNLSRSYRAPDLDELYLESETVRGNPSLTDERSLSADSTLRLSLDPIEISFGGFAQKIQSTVLFLPVTSYLFEAQNVDDIFAYGSETSLGSSFGVFDFRLWHTFTISENDEGQPSPQQPRHQGGARLSFDQPLVGSWFDAVRAFTEVVARSETPLDLFGSLKSDGFAVVNAGASFAVAHLTLSFAVRNLFDDQTREGALLRPLAGRSVSASLTGTF